MHLLRLTGLTLVITAIFLALASAATKTKTLRLKKPAWARSAQVSDVPPQTEAPVGEGEAAPLVEFYAIPVIWPLAVAGMGGLFMWFAPAALQPTPQKTRRRRRKRRRR